MRRSSPYVTFVPTANIAISNGHDLPAVRKCLVTHDAEAQRIAEAGRHFIERVLSEELQEVYMRALLTGYAALQRGRGRR